MAKYGMYIVPFKESVSESESWISLKGVDKNRDILTGMVDMTAKRYENMTLKEACLFRIKEECEAKRGLGINPNKLDFDNAFFVDTKKVDKFYQKLSENYGFEIRSTINSCISDESQTEIIRWTGSKKSNPANIFYQFILFKDNKIESDFSVFLKDSKHDYKPTTPQKKADFEIQRVYATKTKASILMNSFTGFGKTWGTIYSLVNIKAKKNLIHTYKTDVMETWKDEFNGDIKFFKFFKGNIFIIKNQEDLNTVKNWYILNKNEEPFAIIVSDHISKRMSKSAKKTFRKELANFLNSINFDTVCGDECHYGQYNDQFKDTRLWNLNSKLYIDISATPLPNIRFKTYDSIVGQSLAEAYNFKAELLRKKANAEYILEEDKRYLSLPDIHCIIKPLRIKLIKAYQSIGYNQFNSNKWWEVASLSDRKEKLRLDSTRISISSDDIVEKTGEYYNQKPLYDLQSPEHIVEVFDTLKAIEAYVSAAIEYFAENDTFRKTTILECHSTKDVRKAIKYCKEHLNERIIIATISSGLTGISIPSLVKLSFECSPESIIRIIQGTGRLTRTCDWKKDVYVYFNSVDIILNACFDEINKGKKDGRYWKDEEAKAKVIELLKVLNLTPFDEVGNIEEFNIIDKYEEFYQNCIKNVNNPKSIENTISIDMMSNIVNKFLEAKNIAKEQKKASYKDINNVTDRNPGLKGISSRKKGSYLNKNTQEEKPTDTNWNNFITICKYFRTFLKYCKEHFNETNITTLISKIESTYGKEFKAFVGFDYFTEFSDGINMDMCQEILNQSNSIDWDYDGSERNVAEEIAKQLVNPYLSKDNSSAFISGGFNLIKEFYEKDYTSLTYYYFSMAERMVMEHKSNSNGITVNYTIYSENNMLTEKIIVGNPPYLKDTFLKITQQCLKNKDLVELDFIMPTKWLEDPLKDVKDGYYKKYKDSIATKISTLEVLDPDVKKDFGIEYYGNLGIYRFIYGIYEFDYQNFSNTLLSDKDLSILNAVKDSKVKGLLEVIETDTRDGVRVPLTNIAGNRGKLPIYKELMYAVDGMVEKEEKWLDWTKCKNMGGYDKPENSNLPKSIKFNTIEEAKNFYNSINTDWYKHLCDFLTVDQNIPLFFLPWMGEIVNPRTGLKGYLSDWTSEDFVSYFGA